MSRFIFESILSIALGLVCGAAAIPKLRAPRQFVLAAIEYRVLPMPAAVVAGWVIPWLELWLCLFLITGIAIRTTAVILTILLLGFTIAVTMNLARRRDLDCHCFGSRGGRIGVTVLGRDVVLLTAAGALTVLDDRWLDPSPWSPLGAIGADGRPIMTALTVLTVASASIAFGVPDVVRRMLATGKEDKYPAAARDEPTV